MYSRSSGGVWGDLIGAIVMMALLAVRFLLVACVVPAILIGLTALLRLQTLALGWLVPRLAAAVGQTSESTSAPLRVTTTILIYVLLAVGAYLTVFAGGHMALVFIVGCVGALFGVLMAVLSGNGSGAGADYLDRLTYWRER